MNLLSTPLLLLALAAPLLSGCKKDEPVIPAALTTGSLSGTVSPVGSITQVTAKTSGGLTFPATPNATTGAFSLADLAPGTYTLSFAVATGYQPVADRTISIVAGQTAVVGTVQATSDGSIKSGRISWTANGQTYTTTAVTGIVDRQTNHSFGLSGKATSGNVVDEVILALGTTFSGTGSYGYNSPYNSAIYQRITGGTTTFSYTSGGSSDSIGTLVVTQYDEAAGTVSGTFDFVAPISISGNGPAIITNGTFLVRF